MMDSSTTNLQVAHNTGQEHVTVIDNSPPPPSDQHNPQTPMAETSNETANNTGWETAQRRYEAGLRARLEAVFAPPTGSSPTSIAESDTTADAGNSVPVTARRFARVALDGGSTWMREQGQDLIQGFKVPELEEENSDPFHGRKPRLPTRTVTLHRKYTDNELLDLLVETTEAYSSVEAIDSEWADREEWALIDAAEEERVEREVFLKPYNTEFKRDAMSMESRLKGLSEEQIMEDDAEILMGELMKRYRHRGLPEEDTAEVDGVRRVPKRVCRR